MKALIGALLLWSTLAAASPIPMVTPPKGWTADPERAATLATKVSALKQFGGAKVVVATEVYVPPTPGVALFVTRITSESLIGTRSAAARMALDEFRASAPKPYDLRDGEDPAARTYTAHAEWVDLTVQTQTRASLTIAFDAEHIATARGECLSSDEADGALVNACVQALATLDAGIPFESRVAVTLAPEGSAEPEPRPETSEPPRITDGQQVHLTPMTIAQSKPDADRRPIYLGAGIVVLAAVFWWNRRQRERFDREDASGGTREERRERRERPDDDADDLAAAARGDEPKDET